MAKPATCLIFLRLSFCILNFALIIKMTWYVGTLTLAGVILGTLTGLILKQLPVAVAIGAAAGAWLDAWLHNREQES